MTPITREQAIALADKYGLFAMADEVKIVRFFYAFQNALTDFAEQVRQQVIADLEKMNSGLPAFKIMSLQAKIDRLEEERDTAATDRFDEMADLRAELEQSEARARRCYDSAMGQLVSPVMTYEEWCAAIDAALNKEPGHEA